MSDARILSEGPRFWLPGELIPAVVQDHETKEVLMVGYMNPEAWQFTMREGRMYYYSRKKKRIWLKGEQSGHYQYVKQVFLNCDNTSLLFEVEQIGGACDLGYKSCFDDKIWENGAFRSREASKVFDPHEAYGENFTMEIVLGIPTGSLEEMTFLLLEKADYKIGRESSRSYHPKVMNDPTLKLFMARAQELPSLVEQGVLDAALTGIDLVEETKVSIQDVVDLGYNKMGLGPVAIALAIPQDKRLQSLKDLHGKCIATPYPNIVQRFFEGKGVSIRIVPSFGATEGKVPLVADAIVDLVETGTTLLANNLKPILKLYETTVHLIAHNESWGYTWKRRRLEHLAKRLLDASQDMPPNPKDTIEITSHLDEQV